MTAEELGLKKFSDFNINDIDEYGFLRAPEYNNEEYKSFRSDYIGVLAIRSQKWSELLLRQNPVKKSRKLKRYIRQGIPYAFRGLVWLTVSGAGNMKRRMPGNYYDNMLRDYRNDAVKEMILLDIPRTYPDNIFFESSLRIRSELYNVLTAYARFNPDVGYCQGLNYIAGMLILATKSEETTFWLLRALVENILPDYYSSTMEGVTVDIEVLAELIRMILPDVHEHISKLGLPWAVVTTKWFVCLYADVLPAETVFRIWDCLFSEGSKIIFRVGITLIKKYRTQLLACENITEATECFKQMTKNSFVLHCHEFMQSIFQEPGKLSNSTIQKLRQKIRKQKNIKSKKDKEEDSDDDDDTDKEESATKN